MELKNEKYLTNFLDTVTILRRNSKDGYIVSKDIIADEVMLSAINEIMLVYNMKSLKRNDTLSTFFLLIDEIKKNIILVQFYNQETSVFIRSADYSYETDIRATQFSSSVIRLSNDMLSVYFYELKAIIDTCTNTDDEHRININIYLSKIMKEEIR